MPRAYLRLDPNVDQVYPELRNTFAGLLCSGHRQPERGRYRNRRLVEELHSRPFVARCYVRGDLVDLPDGRVYIDGWDEWQEGDFTVAETDVFFAISGRVSKVYSAGRAPRPERAAASAVAAADAAAAAARASASA